MPTISAVLIVRNEARRLPATLEALRGAVDEIIVVDTGSTDETIAIARAHGAVVRAIAWQQDFAAARNEAISLASGDWVLSIDADEVLQQPEAAAARLRHFAATRPAHCVGTVTIRNVADGHADLLATVDETERFFRRGCFSFVGRVHEQLAPAQGDKESAPTGITLVHTGYAQAPNDPEHKSLRNIPLLQAELAERPGDEYLWYQLGKAHFARKAHAPAVEAFQQALAHIDFAPGAARGSEGPVSRAVLTGLITSLAYAFANLGQAERARDLLDSHARLAHIGTHRADFPHAQGYIALQLGDFAAARRHYTAALALGPEAEDVCGTGSFASQYHLGLLAEAAGAPNAARARYRAALASHPGHALSLARLATLEGTGPVA